MAALRVNAPIDTRDQPMEICVDIGGLPFLLRSLDAGFLAMLRRRYAVFLRPPPLPESAGEPCICLDIDLVRPTRRADRDELEVGFEAGRWLMRRGDFRAQWDPASRHGTVRQYAYPYAIDSVIRIIMSLTLARRGGFLLHSASAVRGGRAFLFCGVSGAGKTTIARMAPPDATLLSDEISCVRRLGAAYQAFGTPFAGELGISGERVAAPIGALYFLRKGPRNRIAALDPARAAALLLRNILFFAHDPALVERVFATACDFTARVAAAELTFRPDETVWELIA